MRGASKEGRRRGWVRLFAVTLGLLTLASAFIAAGAIGSGGSGAPSAATLQAASGQAAAGPAAPGQDIGVLAATIAPDAALLHDGDGVATVSLADVTSTDLPVRGVRATLRCPLRHEWRALAGRRGGVARADPGPASSRVPPPLR